MKHVVFGLLALLVSNASYSATQGFDIKFELSKDGEVLFRPRIIARENEKASFSQSVKDGREELAIELIANNISNEKIDNGIKIRMAVRYQYHGKQFEAHSSAVIRNGSQTMVTLNEKDDKEKLTLTISANPVTLNQ